MFGLRSSVEKPRSSVEKPRSSVKNPRCSVEKPRSSAEPPRSSVEKPRRCALAAAAKVNIFFLFSKLPAPFLQKPPPHPTKTMPFLFKNDALPFPKRRASFSNASAVVSKNHCSRFQKPLRSFSKTTAVVSQNHCGRCVGIVGRSATLSGSIASPCAQSGGKKSSLRFDFSPPVTQPLRGR